MSVEPVTTDVTATPVTTDTALAPQPPQEDSLAPKFAALAKKEKWIRKLSEDVKKQQEALKAKEQEYQTGYVSKSKIKEDFLNVAMEAGLTPDQIANILLSQSGGQNQIDPSVLELRNEIKALKAELTSTKDTWQSKEKTQYEQALNQVRTDATKLINSDISFEDIRSDEHINKIVDYIKSTYEEDGVVLSVQEAAGEYRYALIEDTMARLKSSKTLQEMAKALFQPPAETPPQKPQISQQSQPHKTLTNGMVPSSNPARRTEAERVRRAKMIGQGLDPDTGLSRI